MINISDALIERSCFETMRGGSSNSDNVVIKYVTQAGTNVDIPQSAEQSEFEVCSFIPTLDGSCNFSFRAINTANATNIRYKFYIYENDVLIYTDDSANVPKSTNKQENIDSIDVKKFNKYSLKVKLKTLTSNLSISDCYVLAEIIKNSSSYFM